MIKTHQSIPERASGKWKGGVATLADLPTENNKLGDVRVVEDAAAIYVWDGNQWQNAGSSGGSGLSNLNGQTGDTQTFATGTSGTDFGINSTGNVHTFNIPDASASNRGVITTGSQTIAGDKTFSGTTTAKLTGYTSVINNAAWGVASAGVYSIDITAITHGKGINPQIDIYESDNTDLIKVNVHSVIVNNIGDITIIVLETPDLRFDGVLVIK